MCGHVGSSAAAGMVARAGAGSAGASGFLPATAGALRRTVPSDAVPGRRERRRPGGRGRPRVAIVGAGLMGRWHAYAARRLSARILAVVDTQIGRADELARRCSGTRALADLDAAAELGLDAIHICTPLASHAALIRAAIGRGLHALVEKPLVASTEESHELYAAAAAAGTLLCPVHQVVFQQGVQRAATALERFGAVRHIAFTICSAGGTGYAAAKLDEVVADILPHPLSLLCRLWPNVPLDAGAWRVEHPSPGELLLGGEHGGAALSMFISMAARPTRFELAVRCERGTVELDLFHGYAVAHPGSVSRLHKGSQPFIGSGRVLAAATLNLCRRALHWEPAYPGLRALVERFYDAVRRGGPPPVAPADALAVACARDRLICRLDSPKPGPAGLVPH